RGSFGAAALMLAREARLKFMEVLNVAIDSPDDLSPNAPGFITIKFPVYKNGEVIGPTGNMITQLQEDTGAHITIEDDGTSYIARGVDTDLPLARDVVCYKLTGSLLLT
ncbi:KH domain-containing protein, partial [Streptomyces sp. SP17BM10]|uniref:KH domain-containing protein n=1 Tax=Streptomyces sp. SP17BM10 TaxID=3002530 RepID=UPI003FCCBF0B